MIWSDNSLTITRSFLCNPFVENKPHFVMCYVMTIEINDGSTMNYKDQTLNFIWGLKTVIYSLPKYFLRKNSRVIFCLVLHNFDPIYEMFWSFEKFLSLDFESYRVRILTLQVIPESEPSKYSWVRVNSMPSLDLDPSLIEIHHSFIHYLTNQ